MTNMLTTGNNMFDVTVTNLSASRRYLYIRPLNFYEGRRQPSMREYFSYVKVPPDLFIFLVDLNS